MGIEHYWKLKFQFGREEVTHYCFTRDNLDGSFLSSHHCFCTFLTGFCIVNERVSSFCPFQCASLLLRRARFDVLANVSFMLAWIRQVMDLSRHVSICYIIDLTWWSPITKDAADVLALTIVTAPRWCHWTKTQPEKGNPF